MKKIIPMTISLMAMVASFLPQKALAACKANCLFGSCEYDGVGGNCGCKWYGAPYCHG